MKKENDTYDPKESALKNFEAVVARYTRVNLEIGIPFIMHTKIGRDIFDKHALEQLIASLNAEHAGATKEEIAEAGEAGIRIGILTVRN